MKNLWALVFVVCFATPLISLEIALGPIISLQGDLRTYGSTVNAIAPDPSIGGTSSVIKGSLGAFVPFLLSEGLEVTPQFLVSLSQERDPSSAFVDYADDLLILGTSFGIGVYKDLAQWGLFKVKGGPALDVDLRFAPLGASSPVYSSYSDGEAQLYLVMLVDLEISKQLSLRIWQDVASLSWNFHHMVLAGMVQSHDAFKLSSVFEGLAPRFGLYWIF